MAENDVPKGSGGPGQRLRPDAPEIDQTTEGWWRAAAEGRLEAVRCADCGDITHYPRPFCPTCWSDDVEPVVLSGEGTLYTYSVVHVNPTPGFADLVPYVAALVDLREGPRVMSRLVDVDPDDVRIGMPLQATFERRAEDWGLVLFRPA